MPRLIRHDATGPLKIEPAQFPKDAQGNLRPIFICACGLSSKLPICDGAHKTCRDEDPAKIYEYDPVTKARIAPPPGH